MKLHVWAAAVALLIPGLGRADFAQGVEAYHRQDFARAYEIWHPLAEGGNAAAQRAVGWLSLKGLGRPQSDPEAFEWYRRAARGRHPGAQNALGEMYANGQGTESSDAEAYAWFTLAERGGEPAARSHRERLEARMTQAERRAGLQRLAALEQALNRLENTSPFAASRRQPSNSPPAFLAEEAKAASPRPAVPRVSTFRFSRPGAEHRDLYADLGSCIRRSGHGDRIGSIAVGPAWITVPIADSRSAAGDARTEGPETVLQCMREAGYEVTPQR